MKTEQLIARMFKSIDANALDELVHVVAPAIVYERPGFAQVSGIEAFLDFYKRVRIIQCGRHDLQHVVCEGATAMSCGHFKGQLKNGAPVDIGFSEVYRVDPVRSAIVFRRTYFFQAAV